MKLKVPRNHIQEDMEFLYRLNNHPKIREVFFNKKFFTYEQHKEYWKNSLERDGFEARIILRYDMPVGCIRRDKGIISIAILPEHQNKGIGQEALKVFCVPGDRAEIITGNRRSFHVFIKAGFKVKNMVVEK